MDELKTSLCQYNEQLTMISEALRTTQESGERESLLALQSELQVLVQLTQESLDAMSSHSKPSATQKDNNNALDREYALFQLEMADTDAYKVENELDNSESPKDGSEQQEENDNNSDIEDDLTTLLGMKCAVYHTHKWGGQPSLHNAMVSAVMPRHNDDQFTDLRVQILYTHPTHSEMLACPFYLDGECKFSDEQCRYSHGAVVRLSELKDAIEPNFESIKIGSRILLKLKPPNDEDITLKRKSAEKYHLWHRSIVKSVDFEKKVCVATLELGLKSGEKRKSEPEEYYVHFEEIFPLNAESDIHTDSDDSLSDTDYPINNSIQSQPVDTNRTLLEKSLQNNCPVMGEWERHTRGIGSKLMLAMGYVPGTGLGTAGEGRLQPVEARVLPVGKSLDHCMAISDRAQDSLKVTQKLKKLQKKEEDRHRRAYEREKEREKRNVFNFLNKTLGDKSEDLKSSLLVSSSDLKQSTSKELNIVKQCTSKDLNIEQFKIAEEIRRIERDVLKLSNSLCRYPHGSEGHRNLNIQISEKNQQLMELRNKGKQLTKEQNHRRNKLNMLF